MKKTNDGLPAVLPDWNALHVVHYQFLANQQNMLEDLERTSAYHRGMTANRSDFEGRTVLDVGAGTGILSLFAAQAGARKVYAVEGTPSAEYAKLLVRTNGMEDRVEVVRARLSELELPEQVDIVISEPWGFFLFHERMVEAFVMARDRFLKPGGRMFPGLGRVWIAPFSDRTLYNSRANRTLFWRKQDFFGVDLSAMSQTADEELFWMPVLGYVEPNTLMASPVMHAFDFERLPLAALAEISLPFEFVATHPGPIHGLAGWFDVEFAGTTERVLLTTAPDAPRTHWAQLRFVLPEPIRVRIGDKLSGSLVLRANPQSSYTAFLRIDVAGQPRVERMFGIHGYTSWDPGD